MGCVSAVGAAESRKILFMVRASLYLDACNEGHCSRRCLCVSTVVSPCRRQCGHQGRTGLSSSVSPRLARFCAVGRRFVHSLCANERRCCGQFRRPVPHDGVWPEWAFSPSIFLSYSWVIRLLRWITANGVSGVFSTLSPVM